MPPLKRKATEEDYLPSPSISLTEQRSLPTAAKADPATSPSQRPAKRYRSVTIALDTPPPSTPTKKAPKEKRLARFRPRCPQNILDRVDRVLSQRFFMIHRQRDGERLKEAFGVLGSTGNVYTVTVDNLPSCSCPDALKGNHCKHILFIFLKVLQVPQSSGLWYQKALLNTELETVFSHAPPVPSAVAHPSVLAAYARATGAAEPAEPSTQRRVPGEGDDCPVCYESMLGAGEKTLTFCDACGNALHRQCFEQWKRAAKSVTCVWCRAKWATPAGKGVGSYDEGYLNLGREAGLSPIRDSSSYYNGPTRRGRLGWYVDVSDEYDEGDAGLS